MTRPPRQGRAGRIPTQVLDAAAPGAVERAAAILREGGLVAFPTETVYGLGADGFNPEAVARIFAAKGRPADNPLILHVTGADMLEGVARELPPPARALMDAFWPGPLTLVLPRGPAVPAAVSAGLDTVAVRAPAHPVALALIRAAGRPLAAPSANRSGRPSPTRAEDVLEDLAGRIDAILDGGPTGIGVESTVVDVTVSPPVLLRPGGVPSEVLAAALPGLRRAEAGAGGDGGAGPARSPGMKYAHYAPRARVILVLGPAGRVAEAVRRRAESLAQEGRRVAILATEETAGAYHALGARAAVQVLGSRGDPAGAGRRLFAALRDLDRLGAEVILAEGLPEAGLGEAVMDRLRRAAREVIDV